VVRRLARTLVLGITIDCDDPDLGPFLLAIVEIVAEMHGRDAVRRVLE
jgi:hypothetical protein